MKGHGALGGLEEEGGSQIRGDGSEKTLERWGGAGYEGLSDKRGPRKAFSRLGVTGLFP